MIIFIVFTLFLSIVIALKIIFRNNPDYVLKHLKKYPESSSLYLAENGEKLITYHSDIVRPLASTVKILIAVEYAMQVNEGILNKNSEVSLDDLRKHYYKGTDGGSHELWLKKMEEAGRINHNKVMLHDVAKGMITYSSNANTDYLVHLLGIDVINNRATALELEHHEAVYPIVSPLIFSDYLRKEASTEKDLMKELEQMPIETYRELAEKLSLQLKDDSIKLEDYTFRLSLNLQRVWSDRLPGGSANDYGKLLGIISNNQLPAGANQIVRDLLEWPMEMHVNNRKHFTYLGSKGGSTAFILNDALYMENHKGKKMEMVILTNNLHLWQQMLLSSNVNSFERKLLSNESYRHHVQKELSGS